MEIKIPKKASLNYPNLNTLRFITASLVIVFHIEQYKKIYGLPNLMYLECFKILGKLRVDLFFVLSGFLITSLLLKEKDSNGVINFKTFYQRRILRIWPLYFLILCIGFFVIPHFDFWQIQKELFKPIQDHFWLKIFLYTAILPNLAVTIFHETVGVSQVWSVGTEEQFYLVWPLLIRYVRNKLLPSMLCVLILYWVFKIGSGKLAATSELWTTINKFWSFFSINCMAIGGIAAVLFHDNYPKILNFLFSKIVFNFLLVFTLSCLAFGVNFGFFTHDVYAVLFAAIILNLACNPLYKDVLEYRYMKYLGSISYGLYMFHPLLLPLGILIGGYYNSSLMIYLFTILTTLAISILSFEYYEKFFLKMKAHKS